MTWRDVVCVCVGVLGLTVAGCGRIGFGDASVDSSIAAVSCGRPLTGHDEDGDHLDDACDPCPHIPGPNDAAEVGQPVGSACDPGLTGAQRIEFVSFDGDQPPAGWSTTYFAKNQAPQWTVAGGGASISLSGANVAALTRPSPMAATATTGCQQLMIEASFTVSGVAAAQSPGTNLCQRNIGIVDRYNAPTDVGGLLFGPVEDVVGGNTQYEMAYLNGDNPLGDTPAPNLASPNLISTFRLRYVRSSLTADYQFSECSSTVPEVCTRAIAIEHEPGDDDFQTKAPLDFTGTSIGVRARGVTATVNYIFIVAGDCSQS